MVAVAGTGTGVGVEFVRVWVVRVVVGMAELPARVPSRGAGTAEGRAVVSVVVGVVATEVVLSAVMEVGFFVRSPNKGAGVKWQEVEVFVGVMAKGV